MKAYQLRIDVKNSKPPVWWRCLISADISFSALSIILDEVIGIREEGPFSFDMLREARIWEPTTEKPLKADGFYSAYSAAHTPLYTIFEKGKTVNYRRGEQTYRIEKECTEDGIRFPVLLLLKVPRGVDGMELAERLDRRIAISRERTKEPLTRSETERAAENGRLGISLVGPNPMSEQTFQPAVELLLQAVADQIMRNAKSASKQTPGLFSMQTLLECYPKADLRKMVQDRHLRAPAGDTKEELARRLSAHLLEPEAVRRYFSLLNDRETEAFERLLKNKEAVWIRPEQEDDFDLLRDVGYVFISDDLRTDIPRELYDIYPRLCDAAFHERRRKINWILRCMNDIVPPYYAIIPMRKFSRLCRRTESPVIRAEEVPELAAAIPEEFCGSVVRDGAVCSKQMIEDPEIMRKVQLVQGDKPYYVMREQEIGELLDYGYPVREQSYKRFRDYLLKTFTKKTRPETEKILHRLCVTIAYGYKMERLYEILDENGIRPTVSQVREIQPLLGEMNDHTPTFYNRGFSPSRLHEVT